MQQCCVWVARLWDTVAVMVTDQEYVDFARDCVRLAQSADSPELRERLLQIAREWMAVAVHEDKRPEPKSPLVQ